MTPKKGTDLKVKRLFRPRWITLESLANVKSTNVISHGLAFAFCVTLSLSSVKPKVLDVTQYCIYIHWQLYKEKYIYDNVI
jgi:hypothetical protein